MEIKKQVHFLVMAKNIDEYLNLVETNNIRGRSTFVNVDKEDIYNVFKPLENEFIFYQVKNNQITKLKNLYDWVYGKEIKTNLKLDTVKMKIFCLFNDKKISEKLFDDLNKNKCLDNKEDYIMLYESFYDLYISGFELDISKKVAKFLLEEAKSNRYYDLNYVIKLWTSWIKGDFVNEQ